MNKSSIARLGLVGLAYGAILVTGAADSPRESSEAAKQADRTVKALGRHDAAGAVAAAEQAVRFAPTQAGYRLLLGQSYLQAGRFQSAAQAFGDTLTLDGANGTNSGKAALNLALTQIATGDWQTARRTLGAHSDTIPAADRGLAMALAGDTEGAVALLTEIARSPAATPKVRQNLALSYALAGQWQAARVVAAADMSPADVDARLQQWAAFTQPSAASDQVASLLGVHPVSDAGQPTALALNAPVSPVAVARVEPAPVAVADAAPVVQAVPTPTVAVSRVAFAPRHEIVQSLPAALIASASGLLKVPVATRVAAVRPPAAPATRVAAVRPPAAPMTRVAVVAHRPASGTWFVQLGAYANAGVARDDWGRARRRYAAFAGTTPQGATIKVGAASFYRLSVGGFARAEADRACQGYRAAGGRCFVRTGAGEQVANWAHGGMQVAARAKPKPVQVASR